MTRSEFCIQGLFRSVHRMFEVTLQLEQLALSLQEISMNAAVAAGHASSGSRVFSEMAQQIGRMSAETRTLTSQIQGRLTTIRGRVLSGIVSGSHRLLLVRASTIANSDACRAGVLKVVEDSRLESRRLLREAYEETLLLVPNLDRVRQMTARAWTIGIGLRIEASSVSVEEAVRFNSISGSLEDLRVRVDGTLESFAKLTQLALMTLQDPTACIYGDEPMTESDFREGESRAA